MNKIKAILIEIGGEEKRLTVAEAKALYAALGELVGDKTIKINPAPIDNLPPLIGNPYRWPYDTGRYEYNPTRITCGYSPSFSMSAIGGGSAS